jgi:hypothetical protein
MNRKLVLSLAGAAAAVFMAFGAAQAAPSYSSLPTLQTFQGSAVAPVHCRRYRHCHGPRWNRWCHRCG